MRRKRLYLVHGTWPFGYVSNWTRHLNCRWFRNPSEPKWFEEGSSFRRDLERRFGSEISITAIEWSGWNSVASRDDAATELARRLRQGHEDFPSDSHIVIAHSHGGNAALYALNKLESKQFPHKIIMMATPFLLLEKRECDRFEYFAIYYGLCVSLCALAFFFLWPLIELLSGTSESPVIESILTIMKLPGLILSGLLGGRIAAWGIGRWLKWTDFVSEVGRNAGQGWRRRIAPDTTRMYIIRTLGDEATLWLSLSAWLTMISRRYWGLVSPPLRWLMSLLLSTLESEDKRVNLLLRASFPSMIMVVVGLGVSDGRLGQSYLFRLLAILALPSVFMLLISLVAFFLSALGVAIYLLLSVAVIPYGLEFFICGPAISVHPETVLGGVAMEVAVLERGELSEGRRHAVHLSTNARNIISSWISSA